MKFKALFLVVELSENTVIDYSLNNGTYKILQYVVSKSISVLSSKAPEV